MYLHTAHESTFNTDLHQFQKQPYKAFRKIRKCAENLCLGWCREKKNAEWLNLWAGCWSTIDGVITKKIDEIHNVEWENMNLESLRWGKKWWRYRSKNMEHFCLKTEQICFFMQHLAGMQYTPKSNQHQITWRCY